MSEIKIADAAREDLKEIWVFIAEHNIQAADQTIKLITSRFSVLRDHPYVGRDESRLLTNLRSFLVNNYFVFYQPFEGGVEIFRILHSSRNIEQIFDSFFDSI